MEAHILRKLFQRRPESQKGDYGRLFVLAGSLGLTGAAYLTSRAAVLSGSGLVTLGMPKSLNPIMARKLTEVMTKPLPETKDISLSKKGFAEIKEFSKRADIIAIGPGLSQDKETQALIRKIIAEIKRPMVIDADGLNAIAGHLSVLRRTRDEGRGTILTPHSGEMARLIDKSAEFVQANRIIVAKGFARKYNITLVLKGHHTIVAGPGGRLYVNKTGNPGMATGGTGDCLTGIIASFLGQGLQAFDAAKTGVYAHGLAGDMAAKKYGQLGLTATALLNTIPLALRKLEKTPM